MLWMDQKGVEASPKNRYVWQAWARFEARQGKEERARELFQRGRELNPKEVVLLQAFALFEYTCGRPGIARDLFRRALNCDSRHQPVYIVSGELHCNDNLLSSFSVIERHGWLTFVQIFIRGFTDQCLEVQEMVAEEI